MARVSRKKDLPTFLLLMILNLATIPKISVSQNCSCGQDLCCSRFGFCGTSIEYCGQGCQEGPCFSSPAPAPSTSGERCPGKSFYRGDAFLDALISFPEIGRTGSVDDGKREIAAFLAHVAHETGNFCYVEEIDRSNAYCDESNTQYPYAPGKLYYGRGPLLLTYNFNYGAVGQAIGVDLLKTPEVVAQDPVISFKTALWFWMTSVHSVVNQGFGATIQNINGALECNGTRPDVVEVRIGYYIYYCSTFGVAPGPNLSC